VSSHSEGRKSEARAEAYFKRRGFHVEARNYRVRSGEIDLIVSKGDWLVFVEVKMRRTELTGSPLEAVSPRKVQRVSAAAAAYLAQEGLSAQSCRFDVITLGPDKGLFGRLKIRHYENAYESSGNFLV
jgi:putative endonuclease